MKVTERKPFYQWSKLWNPVNFQGGRAHNGYFEGWYFKNVAPDGKHILSVIPGISLSRNGDGHAFVQLIDGRSAQTWYIEYPLEDFGYSQKDFKVQVGGNTFSLDGFSLNINDAASGLIIRGEIAFENTVSLPGTFFNPGIMGWYSFVPMMECNHGLVSMNHELRGKLIINGKPAIFDGGRGYAEKDWGRSMPSSWIWMQSNHFATPGISLMLSVAKIPWMRRSFTGFLCVLHYRGKIMRFTTYSGARIEKIGFGEKTVEIVIANRCHRLNIRASHASSGLLAAPVDGAMSRRIAESIDSTIHLQLFTKQGKLLVDESGNHAGLELVGNPEELLLP